MKTPAGKECEHYYEDFHRGKSVQECRLVRINPESLPWQPQDCVKCPVPSILRANGNPHMQLTLTVNRGLLGLGRKLSVKAFCRKHFIDIDEPPIGCPQCRTEQPGLSILLGDDKE
ncbi:MAG: hypothetical protein JXA42_04425 [Anaerolineales bacterium]|nr:hypothetical protein [Anaerolineales bacterium]